eukprot:5701903-Pleurochrysis_carterae.AAC.1
MKHCTTPAPASATNSLLPSTVQPRGSTSSTSRPKSSSPEPKLDRKHRSEGSKMHTRRLPLAAVPCRCPTRRPEEAHGMGPTRRGCARVAEDGECGG